MSFQDEYFMAHALRLAEKGLYITHPNPRVGCVLVKDGGIVGEGHTQKAGKDHAEVDALKKAGGKARGATAYVTLEPCCFQGKTGPCTKALIEAGISRLVYAIEDPHPKVRGEGLRQLLAAGIEVSGPLMASSAKKINRGFFKVHESGLPFVTCKLAMSLDGKVALANGRSQWITSQSARQDVQRLRAANSAIVTGVQTIIADNPLLTVRAEDLGFENRVFARQVASIPRLRVVLDSSGRMPADARILGSGNAAGSCMGHVLIATCGPDYHLPDVETINVPADKSARVDLEILLRELAKREMNDVLFECGPSLAGSLLESGLMDELIIYMSGRILGHKGRSLFEMSEVQILDNAPKMDIIEVRHIGDDLKLVMRPPGR